MARIPGRSRWICLGMCLWGACTFNTDNQALDEDGPQGVDAAFIDAALIDGALGPDADPPDSALPCVGDPIPFGLLNVESCEMPESGGDLDLSMNGGYTINTDTGTIQDPAASSQATNFAVIAQDDGSGLMVLTYDNVVIGSQARVTVVGSRLLVMVALGDIEIDGALAARGRDEVSGAGGNLDVACATGRGQSGITQTDNNGNTGGSGGGGGAFAASAGIGAIVETSGGIDTAAGVAAIDLDLVPLRGGCAGGNGGDGQGGLGGYAGGGIQLIAAGTIRIDGRLTTSGGGGAGANVHGGGGGGGSGGGLLVQATTLIVTGIVSANGGGGGEGSRSNDAADGDDGREGSADVASGGSGGSEGGNGGDGGTLNLATEGGESGSRSDANAAGGGGGGGSVGVIRFSAPTIDLQGGSVVSPSPQS